MLFEVAVITVISVPLTALIVALTLRLVWRMVQPGWYGEHGPIGWALWFGEELKKSSITLLFPLYASTFTRPWYRLMGIEVGRGTELSVVDRAEPAGLVRGAGAGHRRHRLLHDALPRRLDWRSSRSRSATARSSARARSCAAARSSATTACSAS